MDGGDVLLWLWILGGLAILITILLVSKLKVHFYVLRDKRNDRIYIQLNALFGAIKYRMEIPYIQFKSLAEGFMVRAQTINENRTGSRAAANDRDIDFPVLRRFLESFYEMYKRTYNFREWMTDSLKLVHCTEFRWSTRVGAGDASVTAMTTGLIYALKSTAMGMVYQRIHMDTRPVLEVAPEYNTTLIYTEISCRVQIKMYHALLSIGYLVGRVIAAGGVSYWIGSLAGSQSKVTHN